MLFLKSVLLHGSKSIWGRKSYLLTPDLPSFSAQFTLAPRILHSWQRVLNTSTSNLPFQVYWPLWIKFVVATVTKAGLNLKNVLHLGSDREIGFAHWSSNATYDFEMRLSQVVRYKENGLLLVFKTVIKNESEILETMIDYVLVNRVRDKKFCKKFPDQAEVFQDRFLSLKKRERLMLSHETTVTTDLFFKNGFGFHYGLVSGDLNPIHANRFFAKIAGQKQTFLQGSALSNAIASLLIEREGSQLSDFSITFANPVFVNRPYQLHRNGSQFELIANEKQVAAFGTYKFKN